MKQRHEDGRFTKDARGLGTVTEAMVLQRARELAVINGRSEQQVLESDIQEARRELTEGAESLNREPSPAELVPEEDRWNPVADNPGKQTPSMPAPDEQTFAEKLVQEGVEAAEHDQMVKATKKGLKDDANI